MQIPQHTLAEEPEVVAAEPEVVAEEPEVHTLLLHRANPLCVTVRAMSSSVTAISRKEAIRLISILGSSWRRGDRETETETGDSHEARPVLI